MKEQTCLLSYCKPSRTAVVIAYCVAVKTIDVYTSLYSIQCESKNPPPLRFSDIFPQTVGYFSPNFTHLLYVPIYARLQIFIQLLPTVMKLRHIKCDHPACVSTDGGHLSV